MSRRPELTGALAPAALVFAMAFPAPALTTSVNAIPTSTAEATEGSRVNEGGPSMGFQLVSTAFAEGKTIPKKHTCDGPDLSPALSWSGTPAGTKSFSLICDDPDAPAGTWVHWVVYDLPASLASLPEGVLKDGELRGGGRQGTTDFRRLGYGGPCPPPGKPHRYYFKLLALDAPLGLPPGASKSDVLKAAQGHTLAETQIMGRYGR